MSRRPPPGWWWFCLFPTVLRVGVDFLDGRVRPDRWALGALPAVVLLSVVWFTHVRRSPFALELGRELRLLGPDLALTLGALCSIQALGLDREQMLAILGPDKPALAYPGVLSALRIGVSSFGVPLSALGLFVIASRPWGAELSAGTFASWVLTPRPRWQLTAGKLFVLAFALGVAAAQVLLAPQGLVELASVDGPGTLSGITVALALLALTVGSAGTLLARNEAGGLVAAVVALGAIFVTADFAGERGGWVAVAVLTPLALALTFWLSCRVDPLAPTATSTGRWTARWVKLVPGPLLRKELVLQRATFGMGAAIAVVWAVAAALRALGVSLDAAQDVSWGPLVPLSVVGSLAAGVVTFSQEQALATADWQETTLTRARIWWTKVGTSLGAALLSALVLPAVLVSLAPGWGEVFRDLAGGPQVVGPSAAEFVLEWVGVSLAAWALGVFSSALAQRHLAASLSLAVGMTATAFPVALFATGAGAAASGLLPAGCASSLAWQRAIDLAAGVLGVVQFLPIVVAAPWGAWAVWRHGRTLRRVAAPLVAAVALVAGLAVGRAQLERVSHAGVCASPAASDRSVRNLQFIGVSSSGRPGLRPEPTGPTRSPRLRARWSEARVEVGVKEQRRRW